jgi:hypothetical protein
LAGDSVGRAIFNTALLSFRFAAWESTGTSSVRFASELDESDDGSLFRFNFETAGLDRELTDDDDDDDDDDISLASGRQDTSEQSSTRSVSARGNIIYWRCMYTKSYPKSNSTWSSRRARVVVLSVIRPPWPLLLAARAMNGLQRGALQHPCAQSA